MDTTKSREWPITVKRGERLNNLNCWVPRVQKQVSLLQPGGCLRQHKLQTGPSTRATQTPKVTFQMGEAVASPRWKDRWARSIFNNTRTSLCHWRDAEWAQLGSLSTADGEAEILTWYFDVFIQISDLPGANLPSDKATDPLHSTQHQRPEEIRPHWFTSKPWNNTHCTFPSTQGETGEMLKLFW